MRAFLFLLAVFSAIFAFAMADDLKIEVTHAVEGAKRRSKNGDTISMHYRGTLPNDDNKQFDASYDRGEPLTFKLGSHQVISGWEEGLQDMAVGEKRTLTIPPSKGYGARGFPGAIPPNSVLKFETELVSIQGVSKDEL